MLKPKPSTLAVPVLMYRTPTGFAGKVRSTNKKTQETWYDWRCEIEEDGEAGYCYCSCPSFSFLPSHGLCKHFRDLILPLIRATIPEQEDTMQTELQPIHIAAVIPPEQGTKKPGTVSLMDTGEKLKYWPGEKIVGLSPGVKGKGRTYLKTREYNGKTYEDTFLAEFHADGSTTSAPAQSVPASNGSYGELTNKDHSIMLQTAMKAAAEIFHGTGDIDGAKAAMEDLSEVYNTLMQKRSQ